MIKYLRQLNISLIENFVNETVRTINYKIENDQSDREDDFDRKIDQINVTLYERSLKQLANKPNPLIIYSNYRKLFNKTLEKVYKEQVCKNSFF
jgi:hypothetical protein